MDYTFTSKAIEQINPQSKEMIDRGIEELLVNINGKTELALLTMDSVTAMTTSKARWRELNSQGIIKKMFRDITGKNGKLRLAMEKNFVDFQYASQKIMQELANRQCLTLDLIAVVHNKLNFLMLKNDRTIEEVYDSLHAVVDYTQKHIEKLNSRIDKLEKDANIVDWLITIEQRKFNDIYYVKLSDVEKLICIIKDFYCITNGGCNDNDLIKLDAVMNKLSLEKSISFREFYVGLINNPQLVGFLFDELDRNVLNEDTEMQLPLMTSLSWIIHGYESLNGVQDLILKKLYFPVDEKVLCRNLVLEFLIELMIMQELCNEPEIKQKQYELVLKGYAHKDARIHITREIRANTKLPLEECRNIVKNIPSTVYVFSTYEEALNLMNKLRNYQCDVEIC